jgi:hypothetical protein
MAVIATVTGIGTGKVLAHTTITQDTCIHDAKVKMAGYDGMYECTRCHKFIHAVSKAKEIIDETAPKYMEDGWEDDDSN